MPQDSIQTMSASLGQEFSLASQGTRPAHWFPASVPQRLLQRPPREPPQMGTVHETTSIRILKTAGKYEREIKTIVPKVWHGKGKPGRIFRLRP